MSKSSDRKAAMGKKTAPELREELTALRREHFNLRMQKAAQQTVRISEFRRVRRDIARALTLLATKEQQ